MRFPSPGIAPIAAGAALRRCHSDLCARVAALRAQPDDAFLHDFPAVVTAVENGFRQAEALLELLGDATLHPLRADHAVIVCALHRTLSRVESGDVALGRQVADALAAVLALPWDAGPAAPATDPAVAPAIDLPMDHARSRLRPTARPH